MRPRIRPITAAAFAAALPGFLAASTVHGAAVVRHFAFGEDDLNVAGAPAQVGDVVVRTHNRLGEVLLPDDPNAMDIFPAPGTAPVYVEGRDGPGSLAIAFDGSRRDPDAPASSNNQISSLATTGDGRWQSFGNLGADVVRVLRAASDGQFSSTFNLGFQLWAKPDVAGLGQDQVIAINGGGQWGGIGITADGNWAHIWSRNGGLVFDDSELPVEFGQWTHLGAITVGLQHRLFVNGITVNQGFGWYGGSGAPTTFGARQDGFSDPFVGAVDDAKFMITSVIVGGFDQRFDLEALEDIPFSGVTGDIDQDGVVDVNDMIIWEQNIGFTNQIGIGLITPYFGDPGTLLLGDANQNGVIDLTDFAIIKHAAAEHRRMTESQEESETQTIGYGDIMPSGVTGDIDQDGLVDETDLAIWAEHFGHEHVTDDGAVVGGVATLLLGDADRNGIVNLTDFSIIKRAAQVQGNTVIPEPGTLVMLGMGLFVLRSRRGAAVRWRSIASEATATL